MIDMSYAVNTVYQAKRIAGCDRHGHIHRLDRGKRINHADGLVLAILYIRGSW